MLEAEEAVSPDGSRVAKLETEYFQTLHIGEESMNATVTVTDAGTGEVIYRGFFSYERNRRAVESGHEVSGIAFESDVVLLVGSRDEHVERVELPAPGELSSLQVAERACGALEAAYGDRAPILADAVSALFRGTGSGYCRSCGPRRAKTPTVYVCSDCAEAFARRISSPADPPDLAMLLAETARAVTAHAADAEQVIAGLSAKAATVPAQSQCTVCESDPPPAALDFWSSIGRVCAACVRRHAMKRKSGGPG